MAAGVVRPAQAQFSIGGDAKAVIPLTAKQSEHFGSGAGGGVHVSFGLSDRLDVQGRVEYLILRSVPGKSARPGAALGLLPQVRVRAPWEGFFVPFGELGVGLIGTGPLARPTARAGAGALFRLGEAGPYLGPSASYLHVFEFANDTGFRFQDAGLLSLGLTLEFPLLGAELEPQPSSAGFADEDEDGVVDGEDKCPNEPGPASRGGCPVPTVRDRDGDGVADGADLCRDRAGEAEFKGCPRYKLVVMTEAKIELKQKVFFATGKTTVLSRSYPLLDEVAQALQDRTDGCVIIEGHTDSMGSDALNVELSAGRADAVRSYLLGAGIASRRMSCQGYGPTLPRETNATPEGRELNRRVEFVIVPCEGTP